VCGESGESPDAPGVCGLDTLIPAAALLEPAIVLRLGLVVFSSDLPAARVEGAHGRRAQR
jgi:hypothetical protein